MESTVKVPSDVDVLVLHPSIYQTTPYVESDKHRICDVLFAAVLCIPVAVVCGLLWIVHRLTIHDGGTFLYRGIRLGKHKKPFTILKIRTMVADAESRVGATLFSGESSLLLWYGGFLRATKLDELPQLINVLRGEMSFIGPRPVRPVLYASQLRKILSYDKRFAVRPGLTGYSQFLTPYGTSKRIRSRIDNYFIKNRGRIISDIFFIGWTAVQMVLSLFRETWLRISERVGMIRKSIKRPNERRHRRVTPRNVKELSVRSGDGIVHCRLVDINQEAMLVQSNEEISSIGSTILVLAVQNIRGNRDKVRRVQCVPVTYTERRNHPDSSSTNGHTRHFVVHYEPKSEYHRYLIDKYVLKNTLAGV